MKKIAIVCGVQPTDTTLIESIVKAVEKSTGETVKVVNIHSEEAEFLTQKVSITEAKPFILKHYERYSPPLKPKMKGD